MAEAATPTADTVPPCTARGAALLGLTGKTPELAGGPQDPGLARRALLMSARELWEGEVWPKFEASVAVSTAGSSAGSFAGVSMRTGIVGTSAGSAMRRGSNCA